MADVSDLTGVVLASVKVNDYMVIFTAENGRSWIMHHHQDCCESVTVESVCGDIQDLVGTPIILAEEVTNPEPTTDEGTWTFYKFATRKGFVDIRWYGISNGYYSESVDFYENTV